ACSSALAFAHFSLSPSPSSFSPFLSTESPPTAIYTLSLHDALPILLILRALKAGLGLGVAYGIWGAMGVALTALFGAVLFGEIRSEEHTSELQSRFDLVCRLLLEKKNKTRTGQRRQADDGRADDAKE